MNLQDARAAVVALQAKEPRRPWREIALEWLPAVIIALVFVGFASFVFRDWLAAQFASPEQVAEWRATDAMLTHIKSFHVACPDNNMSAADMQRWTAYANKQGWTPYPSAGAGCVDP